MIKLADTVRLVVEKEFINHIGDKETFKIGTEGQVISKKGDNIVVAIGDKKVGMPIDWVIKVKED